MTIKPFAIQGADLTLGGVNLQAGATAVVIPGVTQAVNYRVEEVDDRDGDNPDIFGSDVNAVTVIDHAEYLYQSGGTPSGSYDAASYSVDELDDGEIEEINVEYDGVFLSADVANIDRGNMWATTVADPLLSFNANDWTEIPFRPKMRAGEVENVGGGSGADTGDFVFSNNFLTAEGDGINQVVIQGETDGDARIDIPNNDWAETEKALTITNYAAQGVKVSTGSNGDNIWAFTNEGGLEFPDGTVQTTAYTGQTDGTDNSSYTGGEPLFVIVNDSGESAYSSDGTSWTQVPRFQIEGDDLGLDRVALANNYVIYIDGNDDLYYAAEPGVTPTSVDISSFPSGTYNWDDVETNGTTTVAVGAYNAGESNDVPVFAYTTNGTIWTLGNTDSGYQASVAGSRFTSVDYNGTGWLMVAGGDSDNAGAFYTTNLSALLSEGQFIDFTSNGLANIGDYDCVVWTGANWFLRNDVSGMDGPSDEDQKLYVSSGSNPLESTWTEINLTTILESYDYDLTSAGFYEMVGGNSKFMIGSGDGHVLWTDDAGDTWNGVIPKAYTGSITALTTGTSTVITGITRTTGGSNWSNTPVELQNFEKIVISGAVPSQFDGTYYLEKHGIPNSLQTAVNNTTNANWVPGEYLAIAVEDFTVDITVGGSNNISTLSINTQGTTLFGADHVFIIPGAELGGTTGVDDLLVKPSDFDSNSTIEYYMYTNKARTAELDSSGFDPFTSATFTLNRGTYIDSVGFGLNKFLIGNDDEQIFTTTDFVTWIKVDDQENNFEYWDDISYNSQWGATATASNAIPNTKRGWINLVGDRPNNDDDAWFESVAVHGGYAYVLGGDYYINNSADRSKVYKFDVATGEQVWVKQVTAGRDAYFDLTVAAGVVTIDRIVTTGTGYKVGEEIVIRGNQINGSDPQNNVTLIVDSIDVDGGVATVSVKPGYDVTGLTGTLTNINSYYDDSRGNACAIAYDEFNDKLIVVAQYESGSGDAMDNTWTWANVYTIDPTTGAIDSTTTISEDGDIYPNSITTHNSAGGIAIVGEKYNEYREFGNLTIYSGANGYFDILKSDLDPEHYPGAVYNYYGDFWISGTGITGQTQITNVNYYQNITSTTVEGSGATFDIIANDGDPGIYTVTINNGGTNYLVGHKILVLGENLGGTTPANNLTLTVASVSSGVIATLDAPAGTADGGALTTYTNVPGSNLNTGSGLQLNLSVDSETGSVTNNIAASGSNYVVGDVATIDGTTFAHGVSLVDDVTVTVVSVDSGGIVTSVATSGTPPTDAIRVQVNGIDFTAVGGAWSMRQNLGGEAFVWTPNWTNAIGGPSGDRFMDICWEDAGTALYAVGRGVYEVPYTQALVVKFNATTGAVLWSKDIKFSEAGTNNREARAVCLVPGSTDIIVAGAWYNNDNNGGNDEIILTRMTAAGEAVWQKTYSPNFGGNTFSMDWEISVKPVGNNIVVSFEQGTNDGRGLAYMIVDTGGTVVRHRVVSSDGNGNYNYYNTPTANWADVYTDENLDQYVIMAGRTYVPTDNYYNALLMKLSLDGLKDIAIGEKWSLGEHIMTRHDIDVTTVTSAFDSFTPDEHVDTMTNTLNARNYTTRAPDGLLNVWTYTITDETAGYLEFGDGSKQSFATNTIPQIPAANDYWLTTQDSGKHIFFEHENGTVYIPHSSVRYFPVGFVFTIVNITGSNCYLNSQGGEWTMAEFKLAGRNLSGTAIGIPDSGSGSMVTVMKIKDGYEMTNSDNDDTYPDIWIVSGPGDLYLD